MEYVYKAKQGPSEIVEGKIDADSKDAAIQKLTNLGFFPIAIHPVLIEKPSLLQLTIKKKVSAKDLSIFYRQFSDLLDSGLTVLLSLETLSTQIENNLIRIALKTIIEDVREGGILSESLKKTPKVFPLSHINMIKSGEAGGMLEDVLYRLAEFTEKEADLKAKIKTAMTYPIFLFAVGGLTIFILLTFIIPKVVPVFEDFGQVLPLPTRLLIGLSAIFVKFWWLILITVIILGLIIKQKGKTPKGKSLIDNFKLMIPIIGDLLKKSEISGMGMTLGTLLKNGVPIIPSLTILENTVNNEILRKDIVNIREAVSKGGSLGENFKRSKFFPLFVINMITVGEKSGDLEKALLKISSYYSKEVDHKIKTITILLEPLMILCLGAIVGFIVFAMLLPIFEINLGIG